MTAGPLSPRRIAHRLGALTGRLKPDDWKLIYRDERRRGLFLANEEKTETSSSSRRASADITVYRRYGSLLGDATFTLFDEQEFATKLRDALAICATAKKEAYPLPRKRPIPRIPLSDGRIAAAFRDGTEGRLLRSVWLRLRNAYRKERGVRLSAAELHLTRATTRIIASGGVDVTSESTSLSVELVLTSFGVGTKRDEQEFLAARTVNRVADLEVASFMREAARQARDILVAHRFSSVQEGGIVLTGEALRDFWSPELALNPVTFHCLARAKHLGLARYDRGSPMTTNERFTLLSDPLLPYNPASNPFDQDGSPSNRVTLVENGFVKRLAASQRYAHYLSVPVTGGLGAIRLAPGKECADALLSDGVIEVVAFSSFSPNTMSGDFSAEIRLGYLHQDGKRIPIRAAMLSGNVFAMLDGYRPSAEETERERYAGPKAVRFDAGVTLCGA